MKDEQKIYRVVWGDHRFYMPIGLKTFSAFLIVITIMAGGIFWYTTGRLAGQIEQKVASELYAKLQSSWYLYHNRLDILKLGLSQSGGQLQLKDALIARDHAVLDRLLAGLAEVQPHVDLWFAVDQEQVVLSRGKKDRRGDRLQLEGVVGMALASGEAILATIRLRRDQLNQEDEQLAARAERHGLLQVVVVPVSRNGTVIGALAGGILLNNDAWLPDNIYRFLSVNSAIFGSLLQESRIISAGSMAKSMFSPLVLVPQDITSRLQQGEGFSGRVRLEGVPVYVAVDPILDPAGNVLGGMAVGISVDEAQEQINVIKRDVLLFTGLGILVSLALAAMAYRDTSKPVKAMAAAMNETAAGNLGVRVELKTYDEFEKLGQGFNQMMGNLDARDRRISRFNELTKLLITSLEPDVLLNKALNSMVLLTDSSLGVVYMYDDKNGLLKPVTSFGLSEENLRTLKAGEGMAGVCAIEKKALVLRDVPDVNLLLDIGVGAIKPKGLAWFAMCYKEKMLGVFAIGSLQGYNDDEMRHMEYLVAQIAIALDNALIHQQIEKLSITDPLTGLFNRRHFVELVNQKLEEGRRYHFPVALLVLDIDHFKQVNDIHGHQQGDVVLAELAELIRQGTRTTDIWARYGGEEFVCCLPHNSISQVEQKAEKVRHTVAGHTFGGLEPGAVTISIGISSSEEHENHRLDDLIRLADARLYQAKKSGRNKVTGIS